GLLIEQVQRAEEIHVWARPRKRGPCIYCTAPRVRIKATYTRTLKHTRQGNQLMILPPFLVVLSLGFRQRPYIGSHASVLRIPSDSYSPMPNAVVGGYRMLSSPSQQP